MKEILRIQEELGTEIRTRQIIERFAETLSQETEYLLDMSGVQFISRSAADELYNLIEQKHRIILVNMSDFVQKMFDTVAIGRFRPRDLQNKEIPVTYCQDLNSLSLCLNKMS